jgi:phosphate transport system substrate-binding protein
MKTKILFLASLLLFLTQCGTKESTTITLLGAGASFPYPLYSKQFSVYHQQHGVRVNYQSIGSGGGQQQILAKTVDFGAMDGSPKPLDGIVFLPIVMGDVALPFHLPGISRLALNAEVLADIFLGKITKWDDAKIKALNPALDLPSLAISVVRRSDGSGTTDIFTSYLASVSAEGEVKVGSGKSVNWPVGIGAKGNEGVAGSVSQLPGSIGYVEVAYAIQNNMSAASLPGEVYPISGTTWIAVYKEQSYNNRTQAHAQTLAKLLWWMTHEGQAYAKDLHYTPLSPEQVKLAEEAIRSLVWKGSKID